MNEESNALFCGRVFQRRLLSELQLNKNRVDSITRKCDASGVRIFRQSIVAVFFVAFFAVSGTNGLCGIFSITGLSHHHHGEASHGVKVCSAEEKHYDESHVPCHEAEGDFFCSFLRDRLTAKVTTMTAWQFLKLGSCLII